MLLKIAFTNLRLECFSRSVSICTAASHPRDHDLRNTFSHQEDCFPLDLRFLEVEQLYEYLSLNHWNESCSRSFSPTQPVHARSFNLAYS